MADMRVGETKKLNILSGGYNLSGATCTLLIKDPNGATLTPKPLTINSDNLSASLTFTSSDITLAGRYTIQLQAQWTSGKLLISPQGNLDVDPVIS